jgi:hypothetical protein
MGMTSNEQTPEGLAGEIDGLHPGPFEFKSGALNNIQGDTTEKRDHLQRMTGEFIGGQM